MVAREFGQQTRFIELAGEVNTRMPEYVVGQVTRALNRVGKAAKVREKSHAITELSDSESTTMRARYDCLRRLASGQPSKGLQQLTALAERAVASVRLWSWRYSMLQARMPSPLSTDLTMSSASHSVSITRMS